MSNTLKVESLVTNYSSELLYRLYRTMLLIRQTEEELARCHQRGLIHGACHTYVGQEAIATGVCALLSNDDVVFSTHRGHGHAIAKGMEIEALMAELFGREGGCSRGRGGSMHLFSPEIGMMGTSGIVGPCILQACGGGYSFKLQNKQNVSVAFFGDGAVNNGAFHEGLNMASIWKLPVLFICENNQFATEVPFEYSSGNPDVGNRGAAYGIPGIIVDGNDVLSVYEAVASAVERAHHGDGPTLIECKTYRTRAHAEGMGDFTYRTREDVAEWKERCPIQRLRTKCIEAGHPAEAFVSIEADVTSHVEAARAAAEASPYPIPASAATHTYSARTSQSIANSPENRSSCESSVATYSQATHQALADAMSRDDSIFVLGEGIGKRGGNFLTTKGLYDLYGPLRLCDTPICERGFVGLACGAAMTGTRPVVDFMFADFVLDGFGEIVNQIAKMQYMSSGRLKMPVLLRGCIGIGHSAATHHSGSYYGMYAQVPGLVVAVPSSASDAKGLLTTALQSDDPVLFLEHRELLQSKEEVPEGRFAIPFGSARVVREGRHLTVVAIARMVHLAIAACKIMEEEGYSVELIDPRTVLPLDTETILKSVHKTGRLMIIDEAPINGGISGEIAAQVSQHAFNDLDAPIYRINGLFAPTPYSPSLEQSMVPKLDDIVAAMRSMRDE